MLCDVCKKRERKSVCEECRDYAVCDNQACIIYFEATHFFICSGKAATAAISMKRAKSSNGKETSGDEDDPTLAPPSVTISKKDKDFEAAEKQLVQYETSGELSESELQLLYRNVFVAFTLPRHYDDGFYSKHEFETLLKYVTMNPYWYRNFEVITPEFMEYFDLGLYLEEKAEYATFSPAVQTVVRDRFLKHLKVSEPSGIWVRILKHCTRCTFNNNVILDEEYLKELLPYMPNLHRAELGTKHDVKFLVRAAPDKISQALIILFRYARRLKELIVRYASDYPEEVVPLRATMPNDWSDVIAEVALSYISITGPRYCIPILADVLPRNIQRAEITVLGYRPLGNALDFFVEQAKAGKIKLQVSQNIEFPAQSSYAALEYTTELYVKIGDFDRPGETDMGVQLERLVFDRTRESLRRLSLVLLEDSSTFFIGSRHGSFIMPRVEALTIYSTQRYKVTPYDATMALLDWFPNIVELNLMIMYRGVAAREDAQGMPYDRLFAPTKHPQCRLLKKMKLRIDDHDTDRSKLFVMNFTMACDAKLSELDMELPSGRSELDMLKSANCSDLTSIIFSGDVKALESIQNFSKLKKLVTLGNYANQVEKVSIPQVEDLSNVQNLEFVSLDIVLFDISRHVFPHVRTAILHTGYSHRDLLSDYFELGLLSRVFPRLETLVLMTNYGYGEYTLKNVKDIIAASTQSVSPNLRQVVVQKSLRFDDLDVSVSPNGRTIFIHDHLEFPRLKRIPDWTSYVRSPEEKGAD
jgi:hypothetical protein